MQNRLLIIALLLSFGTNAQGTHSYYQSGRPLSIAMNNALIISAEEWNVEFVYVSDSLVEHVGEEEISRRNELTNVYMSNKSDLGEDWLNKIYDLAALEEQRHNLFRTWIRQDDEYQEIATTLFEPILLFTKKKTLFGEYYRAYLVGQLKTDDTRKFGTYATYKVYLKKARIKSVKTRGELPFTLPQNGIQ